MRMNHHILHSSRSGCFDCQRTDHTRLLMARDRAVELVGSRLARRECQGSFAAGAGGDVQLEFIAHTAHHMAAPGGLFAGLGLTADLNLADAPVVLDRTSVL